MKNFRNLKVWQKGFEIAKSTYNLTKKFPTEEKFGLISQMNRASISITSNIAEGSSRRSEKDYFRFLEIALGSCFEIESQLIISIELGFVENEQENSLLQNIDEEQKMLISFMKKLNN